MIEQPEVKIKQAREVKRVSQEICAILQVDPMKVLGFDDKKVFNINNNSSGTCNGEYHLNQIPEKLIAQYEETIASLKEQIVMLKEMLNK